MATKHPPIEQWADMLRTAKRVTQGEVRRTQKLLIPSLVKQIPPLGSQDGLGDAQKVYARFFAKGHAPALYVLEIDPITATVYVLYFDKDLGNWQREYKSLREIDSSYASVTVLNIRERGATFVDTRLRGYVPLYERDAYFDTCTVGNIKNLYPNGEYR